MLSEITASPVVKSAFSGQPKIRLPAGYKSGEDLSNGCSSCYVDTALDSWELIAPTGDRALDFLLLGGRRRGTVVAKITFRECNPVTARLVGDALGRPPDQWSYKHYLALSRLCQATYERFDSSPSQAKNSIKHSNFICSFGEWDMNYGMHGDVYYFIPQLYESFDKGHGEQLVQSVLQMQVEMKAILKETQNARESTELVTLGTRISPFVLAFMIPALFLLTFGVEYRYYRRSESATTGSDYSSWLDKVSHPHLSMCLLSSGCFALAAIRVTRLIYHERFTPLVQQFKWAYFVVAFAVLPMLAVGVLIFVSFVIRQHRRALRDKVIA